MACVMDVPNNFYNMSWKRVSNDKTRVIFSNNTPIHMRREIIYISGYKDTKELGELFGCFSYGEEP